MKYITLIGNEHENIQDTALKNHLEDFDSSQAV